MSALQKIAVVRALHRYWRELTRPAPLQEFSDYDAYWKARIRSGKRANVLDRHRIISRLISDGASVLDIGCGDGAFLRYVRDVQPSCRLMGLDISATAVDTVRESGIAAQQIDPAMPLADQVKEQWENIVLMEVIEHVVDAEGLMRQVLALQPRRIFVTIPNVGFLTHRLRLMLAGRFPITTIIYHMREHVRFWTAKDFVQWSESLGLRVCSFHGQVDRPDKIVIWLARTLPSLFAAQVVYELEPKPKPL